MGKLHAQTKAESIFNIPAEYVFNTHTVHLQDGATMVVEMADVTDYSLIGNLDSIVRVMRDDIAFYKSSFQPMDNVRIDYAVEKESGNAKMRFKRYTPDSDIYAKCNGEIARLKVEQDTIRITIGKPPQGHSSHMYLYDFPVQVTFLLNNYTDINSLLSDKGLVNRYISTLATASLPKTYSPNINEHRTVIHYYPYKPGTNLTKSVVRKKDEGSVPLSKN
jgi:hypothetical protein